MAARHKNCAALASTQQHIADTSSGVIFPNMWWRFYSAAKERNLWRFTVKWMKLLVSMWLICCYIISYTGCHYYSNTSFASIIRH